MTPFDQFINFLAQGLPGFNPWLIVKLLLLLGLVLYFAFAVIILRQVGLMNETVKTPLGWFLRLIAVVHLAAVIFIFFLGLWWL
jgi:hypothetical protein